MDSIALVSPPWPIYNQPSIQLGTLKAYLINHFPGLRVDAHHFFLKVAKVIGYGVYQDISERLWSAECLFGALMYPERHRLIEKLFLRESRKRRHLAQLDFGKTVANLRSISDEFIKEVEWGEYGLLGFSICLCQLTSSLYLLKRIKEDHPTLPVVVGGSALGGNPGPGFFHAFPQVDFLIPGEGERPLASLIHRLQTATSRESVSGVPGVITRDSASNEPDLSSSQLASLDGLPPPDYDDYFQDLQTFESTNRFFPTLPAEMSRGCWWRRNTSRGQSGCSFCNLNLQWNGYRVKDASRIASEVDFLTSRHKVLSVSFVDNVLPARDAREIFQELIHLGKDLRLFGEIRPSTNKSLLQVMKDAGFHDLQIGIEALSTRLLRKMNKGSTAIRNLEIMRNCDEIGLTSNSNLILEFPGSDLHDVEETMRCLEFAQPFQPLKGVCFWLGLGSPISRDPRSFGLRTTYNHPNYRILFPPNVADSLRFIIQGFRGQRGQQRRLWLPVKAKLAEWKRAHQEFRRSGGDEAPLSYRDGRSFLIIRQKRLGLPLVTHRLSGTSREIYLYCLRIRSVRSILKRFQKLSEGTLLPFLKMMVEKKLMFQEGESYLSLAISARERECTAISRPSGI